MYPVDHPRLNSIFTVFLIVCSNDHPVVDSFATDNHHHHHDVHMAAFLASHLGDSLHPGNPCPNSGGLGVGTQVVVPSDQTHQGKGLGHQWGIPSILSYFKKPYVSQVLWHQNAGGCNCNCLQPFAKGGNITLLM